MIAPRDIIAARHSALREAAARCDVLADMYDHLPIDARAYRSAAIAIRLMISPDWGEAIAADIAEAMRQEDS